MDYTELEHFIHKRMKMTNIYQPIMIRTMLESGGSASTEDIAKRFLGYDQSQINYYKKIVKRWPHSTLKKHGIIEYEKDVYTLKLDGATDEQRARLAELCDLRLYEFIDKDPMIRKMRELDYKSPSGSIRYDLLSKSRGVCVACGAGPPKPVDIDHILPSSLGGLTTPENLQVLCYQCNREKRNRDDLDFIRERKRLQFRRKECGRCHPESVISENQLAHAVSEDGAYLVSPRRHVGSFMDLFPAEKSMCISLAEALIEQGRPDVRFDVPASHYSIEIRPR